jgi:beta-xylosidase
VIPGDFPDPSVIRVGDDFYAASTTGGWAPHFPLLHSRDLINWEIIGAVLTKTPAWAKGDFWAPEIIADKGRYFVYYVARRRQGRGRFEGKETTGTLCVAVATASTPTGPFTDKGPLACQKLGSIDPFFVRNENGKPFLIWKEDGNAFGQPTWLYAQRLDESGTKVLGKPTRLFRNTDPWEGGVVEGAYVLRRGGWFYFFYSGNACCGRGCNYALGVARSKTLLGDWEKNPANPILAANKFWQCPGHGSIVTTSDGRDFLLYHAYRNDPDAFNIGREALLDEVLFQGEWPTIDRGKGPSEKADAPFRSTKQRQLVGLDDEFNEPVLSPLWNYPIFNEPVVKLERGFLAVAPNEKTVADKDREIVLAERTVSPNYVATTRLDISQLSAQESAGISVYGWRDNAVGLSVESGKIYSWRRDSGNRKEVSSVSLPQASTALTLRIETEHGETFRFAYSGDEGRTWRDIGEKVVKSDIENAHVALIYDGTATEFGARVDWLRVEPK